MADEITDTHYSFDATVLPDGIYRFRLVASDGKERGGEEAMSDEKSSEAAVIDHSPPILVSNQRRGSALEVELSDTLSPLRDAVFSSDASQWRPASVSDGLLDGRRETLRFEIPEGARMLLLRVSDAAHNVVTFDLLSKVSE